jgi:peptide/nickel transport system permease protein
MLVNLMAFRGTRPSAVLGLSGAPPHPAWVRALLWTSRDACQLLEPRLDDQLLGFTVDASSIASPSCDRVATHSATPMLSALPTPISTCGTRYVWRPESRVPLRDFRLLPPTPNWLSIDPTTGELAGTAPDGESCADRYAIVMQATLASGDSTLTAQTPFWVDSQWRALGMSQSNVDIAGMMWYAMRETVIPATLAVAISLGLGVWLGAMAGFRGGVEATLLRGVTTSLQALPAVLLAGVASYASGGSVVVSMLAIGAVMLPETANSVRELVERFRAREFVEAARELGQTDRTILWSEIIWHNGRRLLATRLCQGYTFAILLQVTLGAIGLASREPFTLGNLLNAARERADWQLGAPALALLILIIASFALLERGLLARWSRE